MIRRRSLFAVAVLISAFAFVGESAALSNRRISVQFRGPLKDALKRIASEGGINLVVTGNLDQQAEVYLKDVAPEEALRSVASAYHLQVEQQGNIWTLRPLGEKAEAVPSPAPPPEEPAVPPPPPAPREQDAVREGGDEKAEKETEVLEGKDARRKMRELDRKLRHRKFGRKGSGDRIQKGDLVIAEGETINSAVVYGGKLTVNGMIAGDAVAIGGAVAINGHVNGDVVAIGGGVDLGSKAVVDGDVTAVGGEITKDEGAEVVGNIASIADAGLTRYFTGGGIRPTDVRETIEDLIHGRMRITEKHEDHLPHSGFLRFLIYFALLFGSGFLLFMFAPARMKQVESEVRSEPLRCGLTGLVGLVALLPLTVLLAVTVIGIPFAAVLWIAAVVGIVMGFCAIAHEIGMRLPWFKLRKTQAGVLAVGILVLMLVGIVPILGALTFLFIVPLAFGAVIRTRFGKPRAGLPEPISAVPA